MKSSTTANWGGTLLRNGLATALAVPLLAVPPAIEAQQATKAYRIGYLSASSPSALSSRTEAFLQGLRELGYNERNATVESRFSDGDLDRLRTSAAHRQRYALGRPSVVVSMRIEKT